MISKRQFQARRGPEWDALEQRVSQMKEGAISAEEARRLPAEFRRICKDRAVAEERLYGQTLTGRLNRLVMSLYQRVYRGAERFRPVQFMLRTYPGIIRHNRGLFLVSVLLFWLPFLLLAFSANWSLEYTQSLLGAEGMYEVDQMYGKEGDPLEFGREEYGQGSDFQMFCFYVANNVAIDFRTFAGGILFGIGTLFFTLYNGLMLGAVFGYVHEAGDPVKLYRFVAGHAAFEIMGLHLATMAGLKLGLSLLRPGNQSRLSSLMRGGREALLIVIGSGILTFLAAIIEGFWSGQAHPPVLKYAVGLVLFILTSLYLFSGRKEWYERR